MFKKIRWNLVLFISLGGMINYMDRSAFAIAAPVFSKDLNLTPSEMGILFSSFSIGYALFNFIGGYASDKYGPKKVFAVSMALWSIFCGMIGVTVGFISMLIIRTLFGAAEGPFAATLNKMVNNWFPKKEVATAIGIATAGNPIGGAIAGPIMGILIITTGWRVAFFILAAIGFIWLIGWLKIAKDKPEQHKKISKEELEYILSDDNNVESKTTNTISKPLSFYIKSPTILATTLAFFSLNYILFFFLSWFPSYLSNVQNLSIKDMSIVSIIPWLLGAIGMALGGILCDFVLKKTNKPLFSRKIVLVSCLGISAILVFLVGNVTRVESAVALMTFGIFFLYLSATTYWAILQDTVAKNNIGAVGGFVHAMANVAGILGPIITGYIIEWSGMYSIAFFVAGGIGIVGAISVALYVKPLNLTN
ncbi:MULTISPECIES: MFS transporter [unclassified Providencia]|uniref:MFS transporter n=1 Tax=unclassified Providencia TaxID=2633465 RepID=UPI002349E1C5|nr:MULTISPECIES: MFS transporter [unclassified Providencia]